MHVYGTLEKNLETVGVYPSNNITNLWYSLLVQIFLVPHIAVLNWHLMCIL